MSPGTGLGGIEVYGVSKRFGAVVAIEDISFRAPAASITGLIGPNGSGKTTLLRLLAGLLRPDSGTLRVAGWDVASEPAAVRRELGVLTESQGLYARLTVREHLRYAGELRGLRGKRLERRIDELLALFELDGLAHRRTAGFSRGQQARLSLARAILHQPRVLLLDEPTSALDILSARAVRAALRDLRGNGACILLASHVMSELEELSDTLVVLARGCVAASGTLEQVRTQTHQARLEDAFVSATTRAECAGDQAVRVATDHAADGVAVQPSTTLPPRAPRSAARRPWPVYASGVVLRKELMDYRRDRGALLVRLGAILIFSVLVAIPGYVVPRQTLQAYMQPVPLAVAGADRAPALMAYLAEHQIVIQAPPDNPIAAVRAGSPARVLLVPLDYQDAVAAGRPVTIRILERSGADDAQHTFDYVAGVLGNYSAELRQARLVARGLDPVLATGLRVAREDVGASEGPSTAQRILALLLGTWGIAMVCMTAGQLATQGTAGERERRTLEPLLCETIDRAALVAGKSGAALVFGLVAGWLILLSASVVWVVSPYRVLLGIPTPSTLVGTAAALLVAGPPLALLSTLLAALKGSADAATGRQLLLALLASGAVALVLQNGPPTVLIHAVPVLGPLALVSEVLLGQPPSLTGLALAIVSGVLTSVFLVWFTTRVFEREAFLVG